MIAGTMNAWKIPVLESDSMEWIDLQKNNTDMQFSTWQEYLLKVACAMYKISPEEIGFDTQSANGGGAMFESGASTRLKYSRDKGLIPLLKSIEDWINQYLVEPLNEDFELEFVGYDIEAKKDELEMDIKAVGTFVGHKEMRKKWGHKPDFDEGDFPLNSTYIQRIGQVEMQEMQAQNTQMAENEEADETWDNIDKADLSPNPMMNDLMSFWNSKVLA